MPQHDQSAILAGRVTQLKEPQVTQRQLWIFVLIYDCLYEDKDSVWSEDCWKMRASVAEEIFITSLRRSQQLGDVSKF